MKQTKNVKKDKKILKAIHLSVSEDIDRELREIAERERRSVRNLLLIVVEDYLKARGVNL